MRKKDYFQLYPMVRIAIIVVIAILIWHYAFDNQKYIKNEYTLEKTEISNVQGVVISGVKQGKGSLICDVVDVSNREKLRIRFLGDKEIKTGDGVVLRCRVDSLYSTNIIDKERGFDYNRYLRLHGYKGSATVRNGDWKRCEIDLTSLSLFQRTRLRMLIIREKLLESLRNTTDNDQFAILAAVTLGYKEELDKDTRETFSKAGVSHLLALSGLHIGIIFAFLTIMLKPFFLTNRKWCALFTIMPIWIYVLMVGMPVSAVRSALMLTMYAIMDALSRNRLPLNTLAFTAVIMLLVNPNNLFDVGFQLSFLSVAGIMCIYPTLYSLIRPEWLQRHFVIDKLWQMTIISISAQLASAPLVAYYFGTFSTLFLFSNYILIPLTTAILYLTPILLITLSISVISTPLSAVIGFILNLIRSISEGIANLSWASIQGLHPNIVQVLILYLIIVIGVLFVKQNTAARLKMLLVSIIVFFLVSILCQTIMT